MRGVASLVLATLTACGCGGGSDFSKVMADAEACTERRENELYARVAAQNVTDEQLHQIVDECMARAANAR